MDKLSSHLTYKVIIIGDARVGKTSLRRQYLGKSFSDNYLPTLGADFSVKKLDLGEILVDLNLWDLAGQPAFGSVRKAYYVNTSAIILVFDLTRPETLANLDEWLGEYDNSDPKLLSFEVPMVIIGNKQDLRDQDNCVPEKDGIGFAKKLSLTSNFDITYIETSALNNYNVEEAFEALVKELIKTRV